MKVTTYENYGPTGIEWLPQAPTHWKTKGLRHVCRFAYGDALAAENREDGEVPVYGSNGQVGTHCCANTLAPVLVVGRKGSYGKLNYSKQPVFAIDTTYFVDRRYCSEDLDWLAYALQPLKLDEASKDSAVPGLAREDAYEHRLPVPPPSEQRSIARFLDAKTAQIDALVAKKRQLIAKLKEKRSALITRTVTRGLPPEAAKAAGLEPNPEMKYSGVEWIGELPVHWRAMRAKYLCLAVVDCKNRTPEYFDDGDYLVVRTTDVRDGQLTFDRMLRTDAENFLIWTERGAPKRGDVVFTREAPAGEAAIFDGSVAMCLGQRMMYFRADQRKLDPRYLLHWLYGSAAKGYIDSMSGGSTVTHLRVGQVHDFPVATPPIAEQQAIARFIDAKALELDQLVSQAEVAITRLTEYRQALITSAVTGKIDVRELA
jgi:type I restriction enzyme S subunit